MIDPKTGDLLLSEKIRIRHRDTLQSILALNLGEMRISSDMGNGWSWLTEKNVRSEDRYLIISFGFFEEALKRISLIVQDRSFDLNAGWESYSEKNEQKLLKEMKAWLKTQLGSANSFSWGTAGAFFDPRGGGSSIIIHYS